MAKSWRSTRWSTQAAVGVGDARAQAGAPAACVDHRVDRHDFATEGVVGERVDRQAHVLALAQLRQRGFRHGKVDLDRVQPHQCDQVLADVDELADADFAKTDLAGAVAEMLPREDV